MLASQSLGGFIRNLDPPLVEPGDVEWAEVGLNPGDDGVDGGAEAGGSFGAGFTCDDPAGEVIHELGPAGLAACAEVEIHASTLPRP